LPPLLAVSGLDLSRGVKLTAVNAGAFETGCVPFVGAGQITRPERPGSALLRPDGVNNTPALTQKYTVTRAGVFDDCRPQADAFQELFFQLGHGHIQMLDDKPYFGPAYPDIALSRTGAAPAALQAFEMQARSIPQIFSIAVHNGHFTAENTKNAENFPVGQVNCLCGENLSRDNLSSPVGFADHKWRHKIRVELAASGIGETAAAGIPVNVIKPGLKR